MTNKITIREIRQDELKHLEDFLYKAIYQPDETNMLPREVIKNPHISLYIDNFGREEGDCCLVAELEGELIGAVWTRILAGEIKGYGNIDDKTPEFAISIHENYRNQGIGTKLMNAMIDHLRNNNYKQTSLSVNKENYALKLYKKVGFHIIKERKDDYLMLLNL